MLVFKHIVEWTGSPCPRSAPLGRYQPAFTAGLLAQLEVLYGDVLIKIAGLTAPTIGQGKQIISDVHAKL